MNPFSIVARLAILAIASAPAAAEVVFDGTLGPNGSFSGDFVIPDSFGTQVGENLFHSFSVFYVDNGESATFTSAFGGATSNVIGRVTGTDVSLIDGPLNSTIPGASLWLINPNGVTFGANASLDIQGSFHVSTADYLLLEDGGRFDATNVGDTVLTMGNPTGFGFLDAAVGAITGEGANLGIKSHPGTDLSIVGGDILLPNTFIGTQGGYIQLVSVAGAGVIAVPGSSPPGAPVTDFGNMYFASQFVDSTGFVSGDIYIVGGDLVMENRAWVFAQSLGDVPGETGGGISVKVNTLTMTGGSQISSAAGSVDFSTPASVSAGSITIDAPGGIYIEGQDPQGFSTGIFANTNFPTSGKGGDIVINTSSLELRDGGEITAGTSGIPGADSGAITVNATERVLISGQVFPINTGVFSNKFGFGNAGTITINSPELTLRHGGSLQSGSLLNFCCNPPFPAPGNGGSIFLNVGSLAIDGGFISARTEADGPGGNILINADTVEVANREAFVFFEPFGPITSIVANTSSASGAPAGEIVLNANALHFAPGGVIDGVTFGPGDGGSVKINVAGSITFEGGDESSPKTGIFVNSLNVLGAPQAGRGGTIEVEAESISIGAYANIQAATATNGDAGDVVIRADEIRLFDGGAIDAISDAAGNAGTINIDVDGVLEISGSSSLGPSGIQSSSAGDGQGGTVNVIADSLVVMGGGQIGATSAGAGDGGNVSVFTSNALLDGGRITASSTGSGNAGNVFVAATESMTLTADGRIETSAENSAGGNIQLEVADTLLLRDAVISAAANGVTPDDAGGNITIDPRFIIMQNGSILANANAGNGGNIAIRVDYLIADNASTIDASSNAGVNGTVVIETPNDVFATVVPLDTPEDVVAEFLAERCAAQLAGDRSSLTATRGATAQASPTDYLATPLTTAGPPATAFTDPVCRYAVVSIDE